MNWELINNQQSNFQVIFPDLTCFREIKLRRTVEEAGKQLEADRLDLENALHHMTQDLEDLKKAFEREQEQSRLKDELYREQRKQNEEIIMESQKVCSTKLPRALLRWEEWVCAMNFIVGGGGARSVSSINYMERFTVEFLFHLTVFVTFSYTFLRLW